MPKFRVSVSCEIEGFMEVDAIDKMDAEQKAQTILDYDGEDAIRDVLHRDNYVNDAEVVDK
jgi:hypothetical protein